MSDIHAGRPSPLLDAILAEPDPQAQREQAQDWLPTQREAVNIRQVYEERLNRLRAALQETAHALTRLVPLLRANPRAIRLDRRHRRRELRRYIREHATHRRLWRKRVLIDETRLWRGQ